MFDTQKELSTEARKEREEGGEEKQYAKDRRHFSSSFSNSSRVDVILKYIESAVHGLDSDEFSCLQLQLGTCRVDCSLEQIWDPIKAVIM